MKKLTLIFLSSLIIFQCGCATLFGGRVTECQKTKPAPGEAHRKIKPGAFTVDFIIGLATLEIPLMIDFATSAIYQPCDNNSSASAKSNSNTSVPNAPETPAYRGSGDPLKGLNVEKSREMVIGNYYALIIGIDKYSGKWNPLQNAVSDAKAIETTLKTKYKFDNFQTLYNEQATRKNIISKLEWLVQNTKEADNVFIYYSGHGDYKKELNKGFWVPVDATAMTTADFISNNDLQTYLGGIKSKHTLLVADACFSGDLFRGNTVSVPFENSEKYYREVHGLISRQVMTSGGVEPVMDGGKNGHSVFAYYLLKQLNENQDKYFDASQVYDKIKIPVVNNSDQTPKLAPLKDTGDEGGQFIFIKK